MLLHRFHLEAQARINYSLIFAAQILYLAKLFLKILDLHLLLSVRLKQNKYSHYDMLRLIFKLIILC